MFKRLFSSAIIFGAAALAPPVFAQNCLPRDTLVERLDKTYHEQSTGAGLQNPQQLLEIWSSPDTGSFTVFITRSDGLSCVMASGRNWHSAVPVRAQPDTES